MALVPKVLALDQPTQVTASHTRNARLRSNRRWADRSRCRATRKKFCTTPCTDAKRCHVGGRLEASHLPFALPHRLMGDFGSIVRVLVGGVDHRRHDDPMNRRVTAQFVRDQAPRDWALPFRQLPKEARRSMPIAPARPTGRVNRSSRPSPSRIRTTPWAPKLSLHTRTLAETNG